MSINIWTDPMQHAALLGKPVLFTNWLIQRDIRQHDIVRAALRVAKEVDATDEEWKAFMEMLQNRQN